MPHAPNVSLIDARGPKYLTGEKRARFLAAVRTHPKPAVQKHGPGAPDAGCRCAAVPTLDPIPPPVEAGRSGMDGEPAIRPHARSETRSMGTPRSTRCGRRGGAASPARRRAVRRTRSLRSYGRSSIEIHGCRNPPGRQRNDLVKASILLLASSVADRLDVMIEFRRVGRAVAADFLDNGITPHGIRPPHQLLGCTDGRPR